MFAFELDVNRYGQICVSVGVHMVCALFKGQCDSCVHKVSRHSSMWALVSHLKSNVITSAAVGNTRPENITSVVWGQF